MAGNSGTVLEIYWLPGCSACLRLKEFVEDHGLVHVAVNVAESPGSASRLGELGLAVPAAVLGERGVTGVDLAGVAELAGFEYTPPSILSPEHLRGRYEDAIDIALELTPLLGGRLDYKAPGRDRTLRFLLLHVATIMRGFVSVEETNVFTSGYEFIPAGFEDNADLDTILELIAQTQFDLARWWDSVGFDDPFERVVTSPHPRTWSLHEAFERAVWHTVHHVRQVDYFVHTVFCLRETMLVTDDLLAGLPLPKGVHG